MSLINKMLQDLEARKNAPLGKPHAEPIFRGLHAVSDSGLRRWVVPLLTGASVVMISFVGWYIWAHRATEFSSPQTAANSVAVANAPTAPATIAANPQVPAQISVQAAPSSSPPAVQHQAAARPAEKSPVAPVSPRAKPKPAATVAPPAPPPAVAASVPVGNTDSEAPGTIEKRPVTLTPEQRAENRYRVAAQQMQQRQTTEAEQGLRAALEESPRHVGARDLLATSLVARGRMDEARQLLEQGLTVVPGQTSFSTLLARIYVEQNAEPKAIALLEQQRSFSKPGPDTLALLATLYQRAGRHGDAIAAFKEALTLRPLEGKWWLGLGISLEAEADWSEARFAYERVRDTNVDPQLARYAEQRLTILRAK